jgi:hypothetical protein
MSPYDFLLFKFSPFFCSNYYSEKLPEGLRELVEPARAAQQSLVTHCNRKEATLT